VFSCPASTGKDARSGAKAPNLTFFTPELRSLCGENNILL